MFAPVAPSRSQVSGNLLGIFRRLIQDGQCRPGQRLPNERDLARQLGVSRPSLREAIRALAAMNILDVRHGDGTYISSLDPEILAEPLQLILAIDDSAIFSLFELRRVLEPAAAALAAQRASPEECRLLHDEIAIGASAVHDPAALIAHDARLHRLVHRAAHNPLLASTSASLAGLANAARQRTVHLPHNAALTLDEHSAFVQAICRREPDAAAEAMRRHLQRVEDHLRASHELAEAGRARPPEATR
jgi:GntR family transcriptional repressor for pyruvate dehydrogenase complex